MNYYRNIWPRLPHTSAKITSNKRNFKWNKIKQYAFDEIKRITACDNLLTYPYFNETFKIHTDARKFQLGAVISHKGKSIAFYSRKLTNPQKRYTVTEKKQPNIAETLK